MILPAGLNLDPATGIISGVPSAVGDSSFTVQAQDAAGIVFSGQFTLAVDSVSASPVVNAFTINGDSSSAATQPNAPMTLAWSVSNATEVQLTTGADYSWIDQPQQGTAIVSAPGSRNFLLRARNGGSAWTTFAAVHTIIRQATSAPDLSGTARYDDFNRPDIASSLGMPSDDVSAWVAQSGTWGVKANAAYCASGGSQQTAILQQQHPDTVLKATLAAYGSASGPIARASDNDNYYLLLGQAGRYTIQKKANGAFVASHPFPWYLPPPVVPTAGDKLNLTCIGDTISALVVGANGQATASSVVDQSPLTGTGFGFYADSDSTSAFGDLFAYSPESYLESTLLIPDFCKYPTIESAGSGLWSTLAWNRLSGTGPIPVAGDVVAIRHTVTVDVFSDAVLGGIGVQSGGSLLFATDKKVRLTACHVVVYGTDGTHGQGYLEIGTAADPVNPNSVQDQTACLALASAPYAAEDVNHWGAGLYVFGKVRTYGQPVSPGFVRLGVAPKSGDRTLTLASPVVGWTQGDRLFLPDSHPLSPSEGSQTNPTPTPHYDVLMLEGVSGKALTVSTFDGSGLKWDHPGSTRPDLSLPSEFLPHVANLSRWASIRAIDPTDIHRAHVICCNRADVDFQNTAFHSTGRATPFPGRAVQFRRLWGPYPVRPDGHQFSIVGCSVFDPLPITGLGVAGAQWGITVDEAGWGLIQGNVVINWGGAGIAMRNGNEQCNIFDGNFVSLVRGNGQRFDPDGLNTQGDGRFGDPSGQGGGVGIWCRNQDQIVTNNVVADVRTVWSTEASPYTYGYSLTPLKTPPDGGGLNPFPFTPAYQGANPYSGNPADTVAYGPVAWPIRTFENNECYGGLNGMTVWMVRKTDFEPTLDPNQFGAMQGTSGGVIKDFTCWNLLQGGGWGVFLYPMEGVTLDGCVLRGSTGAGPTFYTLFGVFSDDYCLKDITISNCDIQGFQTGLWPGSNGQGSFLYQGCHLNNVTNINVYNLHTSNAAQFAQVGYLVNSDAVYPWNRTFTVADCTYGTIPGVPLATIALSVSAGGNYTSSTTVLVTNHQGVVGDDFQVYFSQQDPARILEQTNVAAFFFGCPEAGLTNQQSHDKYNLDGTVKANWPDPTTLGICVCGTLLPAGTVMRIDIGGAVIKELT